MRPTPAAGSAEGQKLSGMDNMQPVDIEWSVSVDMKKAGPF